MTPLMQYYTSIALYIFTAMVPFKLDNGHEIEYHLHPSREETETSEV